MTIKWNVVHVLPAAANLARWELEARVLGVQVEHLKRQGCHNFDSVAGGAPGLHRFVGRVRFNKETRRWMAVVNSDCNAREAALVVSVAVGAANHWGLKPGAKLRRRTFSHFANGDGQQVAEMRVCYHLTVEALLTSAEDSESVPDTIESMHVLVDDHRGHLLREAESAGAQTEGR